jgi:hypothetical protein
MGNSNVAVDLTVDEKAAFLAELTETTNILLSIGRAREDVDTGSKAIIEKYLPIFPMQKDFKKGGPDIPGFIQKVYETRVLPEYHVSKKLNPSQFLSFSSVSSKGLTVATPDQLRCARGAEAVRNYLAAHIKELVYELVPREKDGQPVVDAATGQPVMDKIPKFVRPVNLDEKAGDAVLKAMNALNSSKLITDEIKKKLEPIFEEINAIVKPLYDAGHAAKLAAIADGKPVEEVNAEEVNAEEVNAEEVNAEEVDAEEVDAKTE